MNEETNINFNKMKVAELRKFVSTNSIFKGGLSSLKKTEILDKIYSSEWYREHGVTEPEDEQQDDEQQQETQEQQQESVQEPTQEPTQETQENEQELLNRLEFLQQQLREKQEEEAKIQKEISYEQEDSRVKQMIQDALSEQRQKFMNRLFS